MRNLHIKWKSLAPHPLSIPHPHTKFNTILNPCFQSQTPIIPVELMTTQHTIPTIQSRGEQWCCQLYGGAQSSTSSSPTLNSPNQPSCQQSQGMKSLPRKRKKSGSVCGFNGFGFYFSGSVKFFFFLIMNFIKKGPKHTKGNLGQRNQNVH